MKKNLYLIKIVGEVTPIPVLADGFSVNPASGMLLVYDAVIAREQEAHITLFAASHGHWAYIKLVEGRDV